MTVMGKLHGLAMAGVVALTAGAAQAEPVKFEFWYGLTGDLSERIQDMCRTFNEGQDKYEAVCVSQGTYDAAIQNAIAAFRAKKHPTVLQVFDAGTADLMLSGAFVPAPELMEKAGYDVNWDDYFKGIANYYATSGGELYSFPFNSSTAVLYWNKDAFAKIGKTEAPETYEEVEEAARALKAAGYSCPYAYDVDPWQFMEQFSAVHNLPIATKNNGYDGLDAELVVNTTKFVDHVDFFKRMTDEGLFQLKEYGQARLQSFMSGECMMMQSSIADHGTVGKTIPQGTNWDVAMVPVWAGTERKNSLVGGASLWALAGKPQEEYDAAAAFFSFIAKPEQAEWWSTVTGYIPVTNSGFEYMKSQGFYDKAPYKGRETAIQSLTYTPPGPNSRGLRLGGYVQIRKEFRDSLTAIMAGDVGVQEGVDAAVERGNAILRRFEKTYPGKQFP
ncbi:MAG TPA: extracellular solute-binding protein [Geminicoccus sp.]|jgi:sn-glycerol 3-phosphate transport system substrate-binding protein|uniref:extracellular solute-binding protein n=1 Tax=Geminicoccus sp. TaxID=2024832 RepID=UPI002E34A369|nr:extracellular solute-binding protein [Geminicoccus sp.]HEX2528620.1 extracellular solute-binding protein [Geminicoccus sp.]